MRTGCRYGHRSSAGRGQPAAREGEAAGSTPVSCCLGKLWNATCCFLSRVTWPRVASTAGGSGPRVGEWAMGRWAGKQWRGRVLLCIGKSARHAFAGPASSRLRPSSLRMSAQGRAPPRPFSCAPSLDLPPCCSKPCRACGINLPYARATSHGAAFLQASSWSAVQRKAAGAVVDGSASAAATALAQIGACGKCQNNMARDGYRACKRIHGRHFVCALSALIEHVVCVFSVVFLVLPSRTSHPVPVGKRIRRTSKQGTLLGAPARTTWRKSR